MTTGSPESIGLGTAMMLTWRVAACAPTGARAASAQSAATTPSTKRERRIAMPPYEWVRWSELTPAGSRGGSPSSAKTRRGPPSCGESLVQRERGQDHVDPDERPALEGRRLAVPGHLPDDERRQHERADVERRESEGQRGGEQLRDEHERREQEGRDLGNRVLDHGDRQVGLPLVRQHQPGEVLDRVPGD